jgi:hypothetical protein
MDSTGGDQGVDDPVTVNVPVTGVTKASHD